MGAAAKKSEQKSHYYWKTPEEIVRIVDKNDPLYDKRVHQPPNEALVESVLEHGVKEPLICETRRGPGLPGGGQGPSYLALVDGRRRHAAVLEANRRLRAAKEDKSKLIRVPVIHNRGTGAEITMVLANEHRLDDDQMARAEKAVGLVKRGFSTKEIAVAFGVSTVAVDNWLALGAAPKEVVEAVKSGDMSAQVAQEIARERNPEKQAQAIEAVKKSGKAKGARAVEIVKRVKAGKKVLEETGFTPISRAALRDLCEILKPTDGEENDEHHDLAHRLIRVVLGENSSILNKNFPELAKTVRRGLK